MYMQQLKELNNSNNCNSCNNDNDNSNNSNNSNNKNKKKNNYNLKTTITLNFVQVQLLEDELYRYLKDVIALPFVPKSAEDCEDPSLLMKFFCDHS